jgi:hypothetical protein
VIPHLLVAAALVLHPHSGDITNQPDPIEETQDQHRLEVWSAEIHELNGPYVSTPTRKTPKASQSSRARPRGLKLKAGHEEATLRWKPLVKRYFAPSDVNRALCVISYESGGNPKAKNRTGTMRGLLQHNMRYWDDRARKAGWAGANVYNPEANIAVSAWLVNSSGWHHWTIRKCR